ncbi:MAG: hypothetical protein HKP62_06585, partial [Sulfurovum sp.]|nr:hypothetical protein [Sulfurovum sp.]NNJ45663.1 hypothetical protein [Sulfurovum sp.]
MMIGIPKANIAIITLSVIVVAVIGGYWYISNTIGSLKIENHNQAEAIKAYEQLLVVVPFSAMTEERKSNADEKIDS